MERKKKQGGFSNVRRTPPFSVRHVHRGKFFWRLGRRWVFRWWISKLVFVRWPGTELRFYQHYSLGRESSVLSCDTRLWSSYSEQSHQVDTRNCWLWWAFPVITFPFLWQKILGGSVNAMMSGASPDSPWNVKKQIHWWCGLWCKKWIALCIEEILSVVSIVVAGIPLFPLPSPPLTEAVLYLMMLFIRLWITGLRWLHGSCFYPVCKHGTWVSCSSICDDLCCFLQKQMGVTSLARDFIIRQRFLIS